MTRHGWGSCCCCAREQPVLLLLLRLRHGLCCYTVALAVRLLLGDTRCDV